MPFASAHALFGLSKLSVWWLRLGISIERIKPGNPQQNGRHERMHLTLKKEATKPPSFNFTQQRACSVDPFASLFGTIDSMTNMDNTDEAGEIIVNEIDMNVLHICPLMSS